MGSNNDIYKLLGCVDEEGNLLAFPDWDVLKELDRREKRKHYPKKPRSAAQKEANKRSHKRSLAYKIWNQRYHHDVVSPRRKATRHYMKEHPEVVNEIEARRM